MAENIELHKRFFGNKLQMYMEERGHTVLDLATACGVNTNQIYNWYHGKTMPRLVTMFLICDFLQITPNDLFGIEGGDDYD